MQGWDRPPNTVSSEVQAQCDGGYAVSGQTVSSEMYRERRLESMTEIYDTPSAEMTNDWS